MIVSEGYLRLVGPEVRRGGGMADAELATAPGKKVASIPGNLGVPYCRFDSCPRHIFFHCCGMLQAVAYLCFAALIYFITTKKLYRMNWFNKYKICNIKDRCHPMNYSEGVCDCFNMGLIKQNTKTKKHPKKALITLAIVLLSLSVILAIVSIVTTIQCGNAEQFFISGMFLLSGMFGCALAVIILLHESELKHSCKNN